MVIARDRDAELLTTQSIRSHEPGEASRALDDACMHTNTRAPMRSMSFPLPLTYGAINFAVQNLVTTGKVVNATRWHGRKRMNILIYSGEMGTSDRLRSTRHLSLPFRTLLEKHVQLA